MATQFMLTKNRLARLMKHIKAHGNDGFKGVLISLDGKPTIKPVYESKKTGTITMAATSTSSVTGDGAEDLCPHPPGCDDIPEESESI